IRTPPSVSTTMIVPLYTAAFINGRCSFFSVSFKKKLTVIGIIGKTHGVTSEMAPHMIPWRTNASSPSLDGSGETTLGPSVVGVTSCEGGVFPLPAELEGLATGGCDGTTTFPPPLTGGTDTTLIAGFGSPTRSLSAGVKGTAGSGDTLMVTSNGCSPQTQVLSHTCSRMRNLSTFGPG